MGREIKRVALDFKWPINSIIWKGYYNPYTPLDCKPCNRTGYSPAWMELADDWYGFERPSKKWCHDITQDEVQALVDEKRLREFGDRIPTADEVNEWSKKGLGHDTCNQCICVKQRAKRLGLGESKCKWCVGKGHLWPSPEFEKLCEEWERIEPPEGPGYQLWSTTSEGHPMSPVFELPHELAFWLADNKASSFGSLTATYNEWLKFIKGPGWSMDMTIGPDGLKEGIKTVIE